MKLIKLTSLIFVLLRCMNPGFCSIDQTTRSLHECGASIINWYGYPHANRLDTYEKGMVKYLAECAMDIYLRYGKYAREQCDLSTPIVLRDNKKLIVEDCGEEGDREILDSDFLRWGLYRLVEEDGTETETTILSFMGTGTISNLIDKGSVNSNDISQAIQDMSIVLGSPSIFAVAERAVNIYYEKNPTYITGHSLGATIAEMVCDQTGAYGASFGAPGPWGHAINLLTEEYYDGAKFSVIMNVNDNVGGNPLMNCASGYLYCHVACSDEVLLINFPAESWLVNEWGHRSDFYLEEIWTTNPNW